MSRSNFLNDFLPAGWKCTASVLQSRLAVTFVALFCVCALLFVGASPAMAQAGQLDQTFGVGGIFTSNVAAPSTINVAALQSDGKIVIAGQLAGQGSVGPLGVILRLTSSGALDTSFGTGGMVTNKFNIIADPTVVGLAIQPDGKILASATGVPEGSPIARFNSNGSLDATFGTGGFASGTMPTGGPLALQPDGKILLLGTTFAGNLNTGVLNRFDSNGQLDATFGVGGAANLLTPGIPLALTLQHNGKILVASGAIGMGPGLLEPLPSPGSISRYNPNGSLDTNFGISGQSASVASPSAMAVQQDGKILAAGGVSALTSTGPISSFGVVRLNPSGSLDSTFGFHGGIGAVFPNLPLEAAFGVALQSNGNIVTAGEVGVDVNNQVTFSFGLTRFLSAGQLDASFGTGGLVTTSFGAHSVAFVNAVLIQTDGKILAAGAANGQFVVARYLAQ